MNFRALFTNLAPVLTKSLIIVLMYYPPDAVAPCLFRQKLKLKGHQQIVRNLPRDVICLVGAKLLTRWVVEI